MIEGAVADAGVVRQFQPGTEVGPPRAGDDWDGQRPRAVGGVGGELLPDVAHRTATLGQCHRRRNREAGQAPGTLTTGASPAHANIAPVPRYDPRQGQFGGQLLINSALIRKFPDLMSLS